MNRPLKVPDYPVIIGALVEAHGVDKVSKLIGKCPQRVYMLKNERAEIPAEWHAPYALIHEYLLLHGLPVPFYGDHNVAPA